MASKLPTVAIIGQANVGKSSLFNRMVRAQQAIVAREAGTTRDNVLGRVEHNYHQFWLVDTAGLKDANDEFEASIQEQITEAADAADVILVVVDSSQYVSDQDRFVAKKALRSKKPVILITNKADLKDSLPDDEFRRLGIKTIIRTSAEHKSGITDVLNEVVNHIPSKSEAPADDVLRIALIGRPNVGKSYLFNTLAGKQQAIVANIAGTTRDVNRIALRYGARDIELLDTAGMRKPGKQEVGIEKFSVLRTLQAIEESDVCFLLMDVNELNTQLDQRLAGIIDESGKGMAIVVSKWDSVEGKDAYTRDAIAPKISRTFKFTPWAPLIFTSSVTGQNVTKLFDLALDIDARRKQETKTRVLNDMLQKAVQRHPPAGLKNTHPKLRYVVQTDTSPPWFVIHGSNLKFVHWSYKRHLERLLRETYNYAGTPIKFSYIDEKQVKANKERIAQGKDPVTKKYKAEKQAEKEAKELAEKKKLNSELL
ncbi:ribosome biogenesis GTPase Der [Candidatus Saccharibacteria bacterium RIFCSPHIGHO2_01_FULL_45_15]|nr:MAG: ribosome biogenesis GTPase Der [Candidatus Saccharibacteria bacterium RIFCSPHIGHO2_01_FULL_45_15]OGL28927.1 MAG: ribosome biogenesis GTPase Der [Candidatus Saccharibacteria bacterium RIFCSPHIGHO2_02_FULL_46_12]OGL31940.1 MAG: ribosome biogenesis GTPase Der [Candidatus Saccharibacteria bacterium RIFCSPHIGHO2_12_FULL_44_22]